MDALIFEDKTFCFTGKLSELKRTMAEREVRARKGFSQKPINDNLDFLVIGSIPSPAWKYGDYGAKINKARKLISEGIKIKLISEASFMESLEMRIPVDSGEIDEKIVIFRYKAFVSNGEFDIQALEEYLGLLRDIRESHVVGTIEEPYIYKELYDEYHEIDIDNLLLFQCRVVKHLPLDANSQDFVDAIAIGFESIDGLDGDLSWSEKIEGSASYARLFKEIPNKTQLQS